LRGIAVKIRVIAAVVLGAVALTGCSDTPKLAGSAAIINGQSITSAQVSQRVDKVRIQIQNTDPTLIKEVPSIIQINQRVVDHFILDSLIAETVKREAISVTPNDVAKYRNEIFAQYTQVAIEAQLVSQNAVPAADVDGFMYEILVQRALMQKLTPGADTLTRNVALVDYFTNLSKEIGVEINPRFGTWDPENLKSTPGESTLAVPLQEILGQ
jgi:outer membrane murein-binding lipoprotein Lpp